MLRVPSIQQMVILQSAEAIITEQKEMLLEEWIKCSKH